MHETWSGALRTEAVIPAARDAKETTVGATEMSMPLSAVTALGHKNAVALLTRTSPTIILIR